MSELSNQHAFPAKEGEQPLDGEELRTLLKQVPDWEIGHSHEDNLFFLVRTFTFDSYEKGVEFHNAIAKAAEEEQHHPELITSYQRITVKWWTHSVGGLHLNDFVMAAKCDEIYKKC